MTQNKRSVSKHKLKDSFSRKIEEYFSRLSVLQSQVPNDVRKQLLSPFMTWVRFQSEGYLDPYGNLGFEIFRESQTKIPLRIKEIDEHVEQKIFLVYNAKRDCFYFNNGINFKAEQAHLKYNTFDAGAVFLKNVDMRFLDCDLSFRIRRNEWRRKPLPFAWILGISIIDEIDPLHYAEADFYGQVFGKLGKIIRGEHVEKLHESWQAVIDYYTSMIARIDVQFRHALVQTEVDELVFQRLLDTYKFFLYPAARHIIPQHTLRGNIERTPDFQIQVNDKESIFVEIEPPYFKPFEKSKRTQRLEGALNQVSQWKGINEAIQKNASLTYIIIIGLKMNLNEEECKALESFNNGLSDTRVATWDLILDNIASVKQQFEGLSNK